MSKFTCKWIVEETQDIVPKDPAARRALSDLMIANMVAEVNNEIYISLAGKHFSDLCANVNLIHLRVNLQPLIEHSIKELRLVTVPDSDPSVIPFLIIGFTRFDGVVDGIRVDDRGLMISGSSPAVSIIDKAMIDDFIGSFTQ